MNIQQTKNYSIFKFIEGNREKISESHVKKLVESIKMRNMLDKRPLLVTKNYEILDGQHRLIAAKQLNVPVYYQIQEDSKTEDILLLNTVQKWTMPDYFNYYVVNGYPNYIRLKEFMINNKLTLNLAYGIVCGRGIVWKDFKEGKLVFDNNTVSSDLKMCRQTVDYICKMNGKSNYTASMKFWRAFLKLIKYEEFDYKKWMNNLERMISRVGPRTSEEEYLKMFMSIFNWRAKTRITLD